MYGPILRLAYRPCAWTSLRNLTKLYLPLKLYWNAHKPISNFSLHALLFIWIAIILQFETINKTFFVDPVHIGRRWRSPSMKYVNRSRWFRWWWIGYLLVEQSMKMIFRSRFIRQRWEFLFFFFSPVQVEAHVHSRKHRSGSHLVLPIWLCLWEMATSENISAWTNYKID